MSDKSPDRGDQPTPTPNDSRSVHDMVLEDIDVLTPTRGAELKALVVQRKALGLSRYGTVLQANNGRDALGDGIDEVADLVCYLRQWLEEQELRGMEATVTWGTARYHEALELAVSLVRARAVTGV